MTDPTGASTQTAFDRDGNVTATTDGRGYTTTTLYDALDRQTAVVDALGDVTTTLYDPDGNVTTTITPRGYRTTYAFDQQNRQTALTDALNHTTTTLYDAAGNQTAVIDALGDATTNTYDKLNRQATALTPTGGLSSTLYDAAGDATAQVDALGHTSTSAYDALNRPTLTTDSDGNVTATAYDAVGNKTLVTDPDGNVTTFAYDALNRETQETDPRGHTLTYAYDGDGRQTSSTDRLGRVINTSYDQDGRETGATWITSAVTVNIQTFTYDADGNTLTAADFSGAYTYAYDPLDRVTVAQEPFGLTLTYTFDRDGNKTEMQDSQGGVTTYIYDALDRLSSEQFAGSGQAPVRVDQTYNARGQLLAVKRYSNLAGTTEVGETDYTYDAAGRVTNLLYLNGGAATLANNTYTYDAADRQTTEVDSGATLTYTYDNAGQVVGDGTGSYTYDANGNRDTGGNTVGADNLLTNDGTWTYTYDNENNLIGKSMRPSATTWAYTYNQRDQLVSAFEYSSVGGTLQLAITYTYDVYNRLLAESRYAGMSPVVTRYGYDGANIIVIMNAYNALMTRYIRQDTTDALAAKEVNGTTVSWFLTDTEGTVKDLTDNSGAIIDTLTYSAFGVITLETSPAYGDWLKYTGKGLDPDTGLQYNDNRWYNPTTGRWQTEDPTGLDAGDSNLDRYAGNDPTGRIDSTGFQWTDAGIVQQLKDYYPRTYKFLSWHHYDFAWLSTSYTHSDFGVSQTGDTANLMTFYFSDQYTDATAAAKVAERMGLVESKWNTTSTLEVLKTKYPYYYDYFVNLRDGHFMGGQGAKRALVDDDVNKAPSGLPVLWVTLPSEINDNQAAAAIVRLIQQQRGGEFEDYLKANIMLRMAESFIADIPDKRLRDSVRQIAAMSPETDHFAYSIALGEPPTQGDKNKFIVAWMQRFQMERMQALQAKSEGSWDRSIVPEGVDSTSFFAAREEDRWVKVKLDSIDEKLGRLDVLGALGDFFDLSMHRLGPMMAPGGTFEQLIAILGGVTMPYNFRSGGMFEDPYGPPKSAWFEPIRPGWSPGETDYLPRVSPPFLSQPGLSGGYGGVTVNGAGPLLTLPRYVITVNGPGQNTGAPATTTPANSPLLQRYLSESGGRWGGTATRQLNHRLATDLEAQGMRVTGGAGRAAEEWIPGPGGGTRGGSWVDITATNGTQTTRIQTVTTLADGVTPTVSEAAAAARIRAAFPNDRLILVSKQTGQVIP